MKIKPKGSFSHTLFSLILYPGTELYTKGIEEGVIQKYDRKVYDKHTFTLNNNFINTCAVLYVRYRVPKQVIRFLLRHRNKPLISLLKNCTKLFIYLFAIYVGFSDLLVKREYGIFAGYIRYAKGLLKKRFSL